MSRWFILIVLAVSLFSCDVSSPEDVAESEIRDILEDIEFRFPYVNIDSDLDAIMSHYDDEYLHSGSTKSNERERWYILLNEYQELEVLNLEIDVIDNRDAHAEFCLKFSRDDVTFEVDVPEEEDYLYYFQLDSSDNHWRFIGNLETE